MSPTSGRLLLPFAGPSYHSPMFRRIPVLPIEDTLDTLGTTIFNDDPASLEHATMNGAE